jgi:multidrug efflux pump subunit AcrB
MIIFITLLLFLFTPKGFVPNEDKGYFIVQLTLSNNRTLLQTEAVTSKFTNYVLENTNVSNVITTIGMDMLNANSIKSNIATVVVNLKDWRYRDKNVNEIIKSVNDYGRLQKDVLIFAYNPELIQGISSTDGIEFYVQDKVYGNYNELQHYIDNIVSKLQIDNKIKQVINNFNVNDIAIMIKPNIDMAKFYGVNISDIYTTLQTNFGINLVNYFYQMGSLYWVVLSADNKNQVNIMKLNNLYVRNESNLMVPLAQLVNISYTTSPQVITRFNGYLAGKVVVIPKFGYSFIDVMNDIQDTCDKILSGDYSFSWSGVSALQNGNKNAYLALLFGLVMIFLVLAALFELWNLPFVVIFAVPFALFGAILTVYIFGLENNLYFQISLITLLGLSAKNSILISEFAIQAIRSGSTITDAILIACEKRFRPIIMTSLAFVVGAVPLIYSNGANANAEHSIGVGIVGGMLGGTILSTIFVPWLFVMIIKKRSI